MTLAALLSVVAAGVVGLLGLPIDPFLPLVAAIALAPGWPLGARVVAALAIGPLAALVAADAVVERSVLYATLAFVATRPEWGLKDGWAARVLLAAACLVTVLAARTALASLGAVPAPAETASAVAGTLSWTALHAALTLGAARALRRLVGGAHP